MCIVCYSVVFIVSLVWVVAALIAFALWYQEHQPFLNMTLLLSCGPPQFLIAHQHQSNFDQQPRSAQILPSYRALDICMQHYKCFGQWTPWEPLLMPIYHPKPVDSTIERGHLACSVSVTTHVYTISSKLRNDKLCGIRCLRSSRKFVSCTSFGKCQPYHLS